MRVVWRMNLALYLARSSCSSWGWKHQFAFQSFLVWSSGGPDPGRGLPLHRIAERCMCSYQSGSHWAGKRGTSQEEEEKLEALANVNQTNNNSVVQICDFCADLAEMYAVGLRTSEACVLWVLVAARAVLWRITPLKTEIDLTSCSKVHHIVHKHFITRPYIFLPVPPLAGELIWWLMRQRCTQEEFINILLLWWWAGQ